MLTARCCHFLNGYPRSLWHKPNNRKYYYASEQCGKQVHCNNNDAVSESMYVGIYSMLFIFSCVFYTALNRISVISRFTRSTVKLILISAKQRFPRYTAVQRGKPLLPKSYLIASMFQTKSMGIQLKYTIICSKCVKYWHKSSLLLLII